MPRTLPAIVSPVLVSSVVLAAALTTATAHAGPTVSLDFDAGPPLTRIVGPPGPTFSMLYEVGFSGRVGWRFEAPRGVFVQPEAGGGYSAIGPRAVLPHFARVFAGVRVGWSRALLPDLRIEPAGFVHGGLGTSDVTGATLDAGLALDLRIKGLLLVGIHGAYDVFLVNYSATNCMIGSVVNPCTDTPVVAVQGVAFGAHAGVLFW
jgi:hypothetical protein